MVSGSKAILAVVAVLLAYENRGLLIGGSADPVQRCQITCFEFAS